MRHFLIAVAFSTAVLLIAVGDAASSPPPTLKDRSGKEPPPAKDVPPQEKKQDAPPEGQASFKGETPSRGMKAPTRVFTEKDLSKKHTVQPGDIIEVRLPISLPYTWSWARHMRGLRPLPGYPIVGLAPRTKDSPKQTLGGPRLWVGRFEVTAKAGTRVPLSLIYSAYNEKDAASRRLEKDVKPDEDSWAQLEFQPLPSNAVYQVALDVKR